ncbi:hypothetical protein CAEBREN_08319 [Caenorhabditis brenneri]|uniref:Uncharacterized protein n=1 Tax=Caenorhabditis brenneri TaxID=135651 RepID=G0NB23_CAEBE|nr:hypothetical protein CAEBREN_08319 [Caenorhabditis brenneri]
MTTVEEELLLSEPVANDYDSLAGIDVDLLLGAGDISRKPTSTDDATAALLLDSVEHAPEQDPEQVPGLKKNNETGEDVESEKEELDYDEEEDDDDGKRERTSRYTSERKGASRQNSEDGEKKENGDRKAKRPGIPSLFDKTILNNPMKSGDQPIGVILRIEGEAERIFYPPPSFMMQLQQQNQPIVPRLPNGIPLIGMPSNHGRAGFGVGYQHNQQQQPHGRLAGGGGVGVMPGQWDNEVERFLSSTNSRGVTKKRRSASYSSASSYSSDSRSRSRSSSRSDRRKRDEKRRRRDDRRYERRDDRRGADFRRGEDKRRNHDDKRSRERDSYSERRRKEQSKKSAIESAKALGLSNDYMERMNEQKRQREEYKKAKEEQRYGPSSADTKNRKEASVPSTSAHKDSASSIKDKGTKAYLAVNVCGVQQLPTAVKKIEALANELGPIKVCWRSADDVVSIIFNAHDKAKDFMIKYNGKVLSGLRITVSLEKKFLNLAELN